MKKRESYLDTFHLGLLITAIVYLGLSKLCVEASSHDVVTFPSVSSSLRGKLDNIRKILIDEKNKRLTVAPVNYIIQLDLDTLKVLHSVYLPTGKSAYSRCIQRLEQKLCQNFFKLLMFDPSGRILACGTNGGRPICWRFQPTTLALIPSMNMTGTGKCPKDPRQNVTSIFQGGYLYSATVLGSNRYTIFKEKVSDPRVRMKTYQTDIPFKEPQFVSSYSFGDGFVYFFFREVAIENSERKVVYSRVGRVCQYDQGEPFIYENIFTSFLKIQLVCVDRRGSVPSYIDELQSTFLLNVHTKDGPETFIYGVFTTSSEMLGSSAICRYKVKDIQKMFETSQYGQKTKDNRWTTIKHPGPQDTGRPNCTQSLNTKKYDYTKVAFTVEHPLLYEDVMPFGGQGIFWLPGVSLTTLVVKDVHYKKDESDVGTHVIFAGSRDGMVYKVMVNSSNQGTPHIIEKTQLFKASEPVTALGLSKDAVFAGSASDGLARVPFDRCSTYFLCSDCVESRDPFCSWSITNGSCLSALNVEKGNRLQDLIHGDTSICPQDKGEIACKLEIVASYPGTEATLECTAHGRPEPSIIGWTKDENRPLVDRQKYVTHNVSSTKQKLIIQNYTLRDTGNYRCIVARGNKRAFCATSLIGSEPLVNCSQAGQKCRCTVTGFPWPKIVRIEAGSFIGLDALTDYLLPAGVSLLAVSAFGQAGYTCETATEQPTKPPTTTPPTTTATTTTSSTTITPIASAPTTTHVPTSGPLPRQACKRYEHVSYRTPLIVVSILLGIMTAICGALIALIIFTRIRRYSVDEDGEFSNDSDQVDGRRGRRDIYIVKFSRKSSRKSSSKSRNEAARNESRKALIRTSSNDSNPVYKTTVVEMNHKNDKEAAVGNHHNHEITKS